MGGSVDGLHNAFVASPHHYENLVDPAFTQVGIGIAMSGSTIFVAEEFMQLMPAKSTAPVPAGVTRGVAPTTTTTAPRPPAPKPPAPKPVTAAAKAPDRLKVARLNRQLLEISMPEMVSLLEQPYKVKIQPIRGFQGRDLGSADAQRRCRTASPCAGVPRMTYPLPVRI